MYKIYNVIIFLDFSGWKFQQDIDQFAPWENKIYYPCSSEEFSDGFKINGLR